MIVTAGYCNSCMLGASGLGSPGASPLDRDIGRQQDVTRGKGRAGVKAGRFSRGQGGVVLILHTW